MNHRTEQRSLLNDVFGGSAPGDFRAALLDETLRRVRHRRRWRQTRRAGGVLALTLLAGWLLWLWSPEKIPTARQILKATPARSFQLVETKPFPAYEIVTTKDFTGVNVVSSKSSVVSIATSSSRFRYLSDEQLLALISPRPSALIRTGPNSKKLIFP